MPGNSHPLTKGQAAALVHLAKAMPQDDEMPANGMHTGATFGELRAAGASAGDLRWLMSHRHVAPADMPRGARPRADEIAAMAIDENTRFTLTYGGRLFIHSHGLNGAPRVKQRLASKRIEWRPAEYVLLVDGRVAREYKRRATKQWPFLDQFAAQNWRRPLKIEFDCDGRDRAHRLREIVSDLNDGLDESLLHFELDGEGRVTFRIGQAELARQTA